MTEPPKAPEGKKDACGTYVEQTKLLVTLASVFVVAPAALIPLFQGDKGLQARLHVSGLLWAERLFIASVFLGYVVLGTIAGSQDQGTYNVYRPATRYVSFAQILAYLGGLAVFINFIADLIRAKPSLPVA